MEKKPSPEKIGGWLLVLTIAFFLSALNKLSAIINFLLKQVGISSYQENPQIQELLGKIDPGIEIQLISIILAIASLTILIIAIFNILKRKEKGKNLALIALWALFVTSLFGAIFTLILIPQTFEAMQPIQEMEEGYFELAKTMAYFITIAGSILNLVWTIVWTIYLKKSKRVKNSLIEK